VASGCSTNGHRIDRLAAEGGLQKQRVAVAPYSLIIYTRSVATAGPGPQRLLVYIEGDGLPWGSSGMQPAADPTTGNPLALRMMLGTTGPAIYVARPCYQEPDARCTPDDWTGGRYAPQIVESMSAAITAESRQLGISDLVLIGYSGGGALAVLIGERLASVSAVITIGANLDVAAWANHHGYLPLAASLNPALSQQPHNWPEFHFAGADDKIVPPATVERYFQRYPAAQRLVVDHANHVCCWEADWPALLNDVLKTLD
jgi:pimeloyl-ACP methyl ester carboxylesterase